MRAPEAVIDRMYTNAEQFMSVDELEKLIEPSAVHVYEEASSDGQSLAIRTQHRSGYDGTGGGFKMVPLPEGVSREELILGGRLETLRLALLMMLKGNLIDLDLPEGFGNDFGGAKGLAFVPPEILSSPEKKEAFFRRYAEAQYDKGVLGVGIDRHAPDMNTGSAEMDAAADLLRAITGDYVDGAAFSGKSLDNGGLEGREIATGLGMVYALGSHLEAIGRNPAGMTVAIQGSGNVGYHFAKLASEYLDVRVIGMSDKDKAVVGDRDNPLEIDKTITFEGRGIGKWDEDKHHQLGHPDDLLESEADIFVFAAAPDAVTAEKGNIGRLQSKIIVAGANDPMDGTAIDYYKSDGREIIPDILANVGGFVASNFEYNQNMTQEKWSLALATTTLKMVMETAYKNVRNEAVERGDERDLVNAASGYAVKKQYEKTPTGLYVADSRSLQNL